MVFREESKGEGERGKKKNQCDSKTWIGFSPPETKPETQICDLTGNWISNLSVCRTTPNQLSHIGWGLQNIFGHWFFFYWFKRFIHLFNKYLLSTYYLGGHWVIHCLHGIYSWSGRGHEGRKYSSNNHTKILKYAVKKRYIVIREPVWVILPGRDKLRPGGWLEINLIDMGRSVFMTGNSKAASAVAEWGLQTGRTPWMPVFNRHLGSVTKGWAGAARSTINPTLTRGLCFSFSHWASSKDFAWKQRSAT